MAGISPRACGGARNQLRNVDAYDLGRNMAVFLIDALALTGAVWLALITVAVMWLLLG